MRKPRQHRFTEDESSKGGKIGFYKTVEKLQRSENLTFAEAVRKLKNRINEEEK